MALSQEKTKPELPKMKRLKEHNDFADRKRHLTIGDDGQDFRAVKGPAPANDEADTETDDDAAVNGR